jgi:hypothetical protein
MIARAVAYLATSILILTVAGCDPVVSVAGADFPGWLLCAVGGALLSTLCRPLFLAADLERYLHPLPLFYGGLITMFALIAWVIFFSNV